MAGSKDKVDDIPFDIREASRQDLSTSRVLLLRSVLHLRPPPNLPIQPRTQKPSQDPGDDACVRGLAYGEALHPGGKKQKRAEERPSGQATS
ncbi:hypothetical protein D623_10022983 [Myotis brandtii]|uniref:Uncharacterized protein n=1 Tax=Myotis brandtii TaxID=109478 RepID=S7PG86_MYOBR|nr:hypothetical protein D623_10022983 [Myotis brandtii]